MLGDHLPDNRRQLNRCEAGGDAVCVRQAQERLSQLDHPGDAGYDDARRVFNVTIDQRPAAIAYATCADDVIALMRYAREHGLRVAPQSTGHNAGPLGDLSGTLLLRTEQMKGVSIDAAARTARAAAGATWEDLVGPASELGLAAGSSAVSVALEHRDGVTLGILQYYGPKKLGRGFKMGQLAGHAAEPRIWPAS